MFLRGETLSPLNLFLCWALHELDPHPHLMPWIVSSKLPPSVGICTPCLIVQCSLTSASVYPVTEYLLPPKSQLNWEMSRGNFDLLARVLLSGPQSTSLSFSPEKTIWYLEMVTTASPLPPSQPYYSLHMHTNGSHLSFRLKLFSMGNKPKMFGPLSFLWWQNLFDLPWKIVFGLPKWKAELTNNKHIIQWCRSDTVSFHII